MAYSIRSGVIIDRFKNIGRRRIEAMPFPETVEVPLDGAIPAVSAGETVSAGQMIGRTDICTVHASISGLVEEACSEYIRIKNDGSDNSVSMPPIAKKLSEVTEEEILSVITDSGIASYEPLCKILGEAAGKVDKIVINCCEEPPLTSNMRLAIEHPAAIVNGAKILLKLLGVNCAYIAIDRTKTEAISRLSEAVRGSRMISVKSVAPKYPLSDDRQIAYIFGTSSMCDTGCAVLSAEIASAVYRAFSSGTPYNYRIITVGGDCLKRTKTLMVPIGASLPDIVEYCGGLIRAPKYFVDGGIMSGRCVESSDYRVSKSTRGILLLSEKAVSAGDSEAACIRCGRCVKHCPMHLMPLCIADAVRHDKPNLAEKYNAELCAECGICSYVCPAGRDNSALVRQAKLEITREKPEIQSENESVEVQDGE